MADEPTNESFMPDPAAEALAEKMAVYKKALEEEFKGINPDNPEEIRAAVRATLLAHMEDFVDNLVTLASSASSESVQLSAIKYGIDLGIGKGVLAGEDDLSTFLKDITKTDAS